MPRRRYNGAGRRSAPWRDALYSVVTPLIFHVYWSAPADQVLDQQTHFMKNLAIVGGLLLVFARGPGRFAIERR
jgi:putative oxidoreductase